MFKSSTQRWLLTITAGVFLYSCNQKESKTTAGSGYVNHYKWATDLHYIEQEFFYHKPAEVKENFYRGLSDTVLSASGELMRFSLWQFDNDGNLVLYRSKSKLHPSIFDQRLSYDENGMQSKRYHYTDPADSLADPFEVAASSSEGFGKFNIVYTLGGQSTGQKCKLSFEADSIRREEWTDKDGVLSAHTERYDANNKLLSRVNYYKGKPDLSHYFYYSPKGYLDSVIGIRNDSVIVRYAYINNDHGDPVFYEERIDSILYQRERYSYQYDDKGNWIRQLTFAEIDGAKKNSIPDHDLYPSYWLRVREITYKK